MWTDEAEKSSKGEPTAEKETGQRFFDPVFIACLMTSSPVDLK